MIKFHKFMLIIILLMGIFLTCIALDTMPLTNGLWGGVKLTYTIAGTIVWWGGSYILAVQFLYMRFSSKDKLLKKYSISIQKDLVVSCLTAILLSSIYWVDGLNYDFNGIDLGFIGIPFGIASIYAVCQLFSVRIAGEKLLRPPIYFMFFFLIIAYCAIFYFLLGNLNGEYSTIKAIWLQISILCFSFFMFMSVHLILIFAQEGKLSIPEFQKEILKGFLKDTDNLLFEMDEPVKKANKLLERKKAIYSGKLRKK